MSSFIRPSLLCLVVLLAGGFLFACGGEDDEGGVRKREAMPFMRIKLRNTSPPSAPPANAEAEGKKAGQPSQNHAVGPVAPGQEQESEPPGDQASDEVSVRVTFEGGPTYQGHGAYPGSFISTVDIECAEPGGGVARVNFATGQPPEEIPLHP